MARWLLTAAALGFIVHTLHANRSEIARAFTVLARQNLWLVVAALGLEALWTISLAEVYRTSLIAFGGHVGHRQAVRVSMGAFTLSRVLPGGGTVGGLLGAREFIRLGNPPHLTLIALVTGGWVALTSLAAVISVAVGVSVARGTNSSLLLLPPVFSLFGLATVGALVMLGIKHPLNHRWAAAVLGRILHRLWPGSQRGSPEEVAASIGAIRCHGLGRVAMWATAAWVLDGAALWIILLAFGQSLTVGALGTAYGSANLLQALPELIPGWLGVLETTMGGVLAGFGIPLGIATVSVLAYRMVSFWLPVVCGIPFGLALLRSRARSDADQEDSPPRLSPVPETPPIRTSA